MWDGAADVLSETREVVFFGYSLPTSDGPIQQLVSGAWKQNQRLEHVWIVDACPDPVCDRVRALLGGRNVEVTPMKVPLDFSQPPWWIA